jgi:hypothetical protein
VPASRDASGGFVLQGRCPDPPCRSA